MDSIDVGEESVLAIGQLNNDEALEILVGNKRGGLEMYSASPIVSTQSIQQASFDVRVGPNPCQDFIQYSLLNFLSDKRLAFYEHNRIALFSLI